MCLIVILSYVCNIFCLLYFHCTYSYNRVSYVVSVCCFYPAFFKPAEERTNSVVVCMGFRDGWGEDLEALYCDSLCLPTYRRRQKFLRNVFCSTFFFIYLGVDIK